MTVTAVQPDEAVTAAIARHDLVVALTDAGIYFETRLSARAPESPVINVRVHGRNHAEKLADLRVIASSWDVPVLTLADGTMYAERVFGPLTVEAHVPPVDRTLDDYFSRMARARA